MMSDSKMPLVEYFEETDTLGIQFRPGPGVGAREITEGVVATFDAQRRLVAIEFFGEVAKEYPELVAAAERPVAPDQSGVNPQPLRQTAEPNEPYRA